MDKHKEANHGTALEINLAYQQFQSKTVYTVVLNQVSIEPQRFGESVSGVRRQAILSNKSTKNEIYATHIIFPTTKGSMNGSRELVGFSTSNKIKNHCSRLRLLQLSERLAALGITGG